MSNSLCIKDTCKRCDIGYLIKDYMKPLMQSMTYQVQEYNMRNVFTKCLNTAISIFFLFLGKNALKHTIYCDVHNVQNRNNDNIDNNALIADKLRRDILRKTDKRYVYYLMLTDGQMRKPDGSTLMFPGHVLIIEKIPNGDNPFYYLYQSYIDQYSFEEYVNKYKSIRISEDKMKYYLDKINDMVLKKVWDEDFVKFWQDFTKVDTSNMLGGVPDGAFLVCYRRVKYEHCKKNVSAFVDQTLKIIPNNLDNEIFGNPDIYDESSNPLTNGQMRVAMNNLKNRLENNVSSQVNSK